MKNLALPRIQALEPYRPPLEGRSDYEGLLLDFSESTLPPAAELSEVVTGIKPQLYPGYSDLPARIAKYAGVDTEQVMITNGTDQAIDVITRTFADADDRVIIPRPSFAMFEHTARVVGNQIVSPSYHEGSLEFPTDEIIDAIDEDTKLVVVCNPNNPTGTLTPLEDIEQIAKVASGAIVYVDEAYFEFSGQTAVSLIQEHPNVMISRTFSKAFALAALRIGYVLANKVYINEMLKVRGPYDVNQVASRAASIVLSRTDVVSAYADEVMGDAKPLVEQFFEAHGITFYPSAANFILFKPDGAAEVAETLDQNGVRLRPQHKPPIEDTLRISIGTVPEMQRFIEIYESTISKTK